MGPGTEWLLSACSLFLFGPCLHPWYSAVPSHPCDSYEHDVNWPCSSGSLEGLRFQLHTETNTSFVFLAVVSASWLKVLQ